MKRIALWFGVFVAMAVICLPGLWVVLNAFRTNVAILSNQSPFSAGGYTLDNFRGMFGYGGMASLPIAKYFVNSLIISSVSTAAALVVGVLGGYAFARFEFRRKNLLFVLLMLTRAIPGIALSLPIFMLWAWTGLLDTRLGVIVVYLAMNVPFTVWLIDGFFREVPIELSQAALIDGCTRWQAFWRVELPLARSGIASAGIFAFLTSWNEFALATQLCRSPETKTLPVGLMDYTAQFSVDWAGMCAMAVVIIVPAIVLTFIAQKHLIAGLTLGGVKG
ncbi:carbohydrate ABC transporter permease [Trinickia dinghuensis]|uniref:Maltose/maltodextrin transport system permease protein MalG n=1 Tax=Trinickia dinghuensis TaxID=2291023 RepID=A0A3D8JUC2_9BURK|nr:carbohydrate ABC transporter permease [Trinickia dinghuensis]RDU96667.1 carbohydrate ABC transporter permease [Trinickia dinghuensis]